MNAAFLIYQNTHVPKLFSTLSPHQRKISAAKAAIKLITGLRFDQYDNTSRKIPLPFIRQCFSFLIKSSTSLSLKEIARLYKCDYDHSSIIRHCESIEDLESIGNRNPKYKDWAQIKLNFNLLINT